MWNYIEEILVGFKRLFSREKAYHWFLIIVIGIMVRSDKLGGVTSIVRSLFLNPDTYESMLKFFRASSWSLPQIRVCWQQIVSQRAVLVQLRGRIVLVGDGTKQSKEGRRMPGVKRMAQESETQTKPEMIHGHMWGCTCVLAGDEDRLACIPVSMRIHDGLQVAAGWTGSEISGQSHVVQMIDNACEAAQQFGNAYCLMDRYFLTVPALEELRRQNSNNGYTVHLITKAKSSTVAYEPAPPRKPGQRGRPPKKGAPVKLKELFQERAGEFQKANVRMYGKQQAVRYYSIDLLWGLKLYQPLRFVLVMCNTMSCILVSTDMSLTPVEIITAYCWRFRIETTFREFKQDIGGMAYRFWTKHMPKLNHFQKRGMPGPLEQVKTQKAKSKVLDAVRATETYAMLSCIAMGIIQMISLAPDCQIPKDALRYQRTPAKEKLSEGNVMYYLRRNFFVFMATTPHGEIPSIIRSHWSPHNNSIAA